jgi:putative effector of murein hydrolase
MLVGTAYMTRGLQLITGSHKKAQATRAEELGSQDDEVDLARTIQPPRNHDDPSMSTGVSAQASAVALHELSPPERTHEPQHVRPIAEHGSGGSSGATALAAAATTTTTEPREGPASPPSSLPQAPPAPPRARLWAAIIQSHLDTITYLALFLFVGLPVYYATGYAMPLQLTTTVLMYFAALSLPPRWKQFLHPVIVSALLTVLGIWVFGLIHHNQPLTSVLQHYTTGNKYLQLWEQHDTAATATTTTGPRLLLPGAGDILSTVLDASIVSLALPMYQYRRELVEHFAAIVVPSVVLSVGSLYAYPSICAAVGISPARSLAFASRSLTLALAIPATANLGGDERTVAAVAIMSGVVGALVGGRVLGWLRIPEGKWWFSPPP